MTIGGAARRGAVPLLPLWRDDISDDNDDDSGSPTSPSTRHDNSYHARSRRPPVPADQKAMPATAER
jgi:hypothetical protein